MLPYFLLGIVGVIIIILLIIAFDKFILRISEGDEDKAEEIHKAIIRGIVLLSMLGVIAFMIGLIIKFSVKGL